jgi:hypothetical protein
MCETLSETAQEAALQPSAVYAPGVLPEILLEALNTKLASAAGLADLAYLVDAEYVSSGRNHLLVFVDAVPGAETALAAAMNEAVIFSGVEAGALDVTFCRGSDALAPRLAKVGLRFDLPKLDNGRAQREPAMPGSDPDKPPILR